MVVYCTCSPCFGWRCSLQDCRSGRLSARMLTLLERRFKVWSFGPEHRRRQLPGNLQTLGLNSDLAALPYSRTATALSLFEAWRPVDTPSLSPEADSSRKKTAGVD